VTDLEEKLHNVGAQLARGIERNQIIDFKMVHEVVHRPTPDDKDCEPCVELVYTFRVRVV
jgi:hypothetical protein